MQAFSAFRPLFYSSIIFLLLIAGCGNTGSSVPPLAVQSTLTGRPLTAVTATATPTPAVANPLVTSLPPTPTLATGAEAMVVERASENSSAETGQSDEPAQSTATEILEPSATPQPAERRAIAETAMAYGDFELAAEQFAALMASRTQFTQSASSSADSLRLELGIAHFADGNLEAARAVFDLILEGEEPPDDARYFRAETYRLQGNCDAAIDDWRILLVTHEEIAGYIHGWIAECALESSDFATAIEQYELSEPLSLHFIQKYQQRLALAQLYGGQREFAAAADLYATMRDAARTEYTRATMAYYSAEARIAAGDVSQGLDEWQQLQFDHPTRDTTHFALAELIRRNQPIDQYQRGIVNYHAGAWIPCVDAFETYLDDEPDDYDREALIFLAWCHEGLGDINAALDRLEEYADLSVTSAPIGLLERGNLLRRQNDWPTAKAVYEEIVLTLSQQAESADAAWWLARINDWEGNTDAAIEAYNLLVINHPNDERAAEALFRAGWLAQEQNNLPLAREFWQVAATDYRDSYHGDSALAWLYPVALESEVVAELAAAGTIRNSYYSVRVADLAANNEPFAPVDEWDLELDQDSAENWLRHRFDIDSDVNISELPPYITNDPHFIRGNTLWRLRRFEDAKREFEYLRTEFNENVLVSYQLALYTRDLGLYRTSILAGAAVIVQTGETPFSVPKFIASLSYPVYYGDLIFPLSEEYGYDPFLQFALVRQESLYESFATSSAVAQGLAQVIPDTGIYIANKLAWRNFENSDLYKPYVGLEFGGFYVAEQLESFDGSTHAALAAYNGGPGNSARWFRAAGNDIDLFVETVNFPETRAYIERIYTGHAIYRHIYGTGE